MHSNAEADQFVRSAFSIEHIVTATSDSDQGADIHQLARHSTTSSAPASSVGVISMPSVFAVFRLITSSNLVGCCTGKSAGLAPLRILSTYSAVFLDRSGRFAPQDISPPASTPSLAAYIVGNRLSAASP